MRTTVWFLSCVSGSATPLAGQASAQRPGVPDTTPFRPLELPSPNVYRTGAGTPGPLYWQQRADYSIGASLDTATHTLTAEGTILYTNNSPDTLRFVWLHLDQNLGAPDNPYAFMSRRHGQEPRFERGSVGGFAIDRVGTLGQPRPGARATSIPLGYRVHGTLMNVTLDRPLSPGGIVELDIAWHFQVPLFWRASRERLTEGWLYQVGQWYPRMAVYDDVRGWNTEQYLGYGEFYLEYGDFDYTITVPAGYTVTGSGTLVNAAEVLPAEQRRRLALALRSDTTIRIIAPDEVGSSALLPRGTGPTRTWRFRAEKVRDVAWAAAPGFVWDGVGWDGVLIQALYAPTVPSFWDQAAEMARHTIAFHSRQLFGYPYPTAIVVGGPAGMEYPMLAFINSASGCAPGDVCPQGNVGPYGPLFSHLSHEVSHQWLPMIVGSNERLHGWQDEGLTMLLGLRHWHERFPHDTAYRSAIYESADGQFSAQGWVDWLRRFTGHEGTLMMSQDRGGDWGVPYMHYIKAPIGLRFLRNEVVDSLAFDEALREYVRRWAFKHPTPADFFRTLNDALGEDLSWFWRSWFYRSDHLDLAIDSVAQRDSAGITISSIHLSRRAEMISPVEFLVVGADSATQTVKLPVQAWYGGASYVYELETPAAGRPVRIEIDPRRVYPDVDRANNHWSVAR